MNGKIEIGCSSMKLESKQGNYYWFRTCDMNDDLNVWKQGSKVVSLKKENKFNFKNNIEIISKYAILGITFGNSETRLLDGMNSEGLTGGLLFLLEGTSIEFNNINREKIYIEGMEFVTYILATCKNILDVTQLSKKIRITNVKHGNRDVAATMHYTFTDIEGENIILEATKKGEFNIINKTIGVMTNSPIYKEHINNLSWFIANSVELQNGRKEINEEKTIKGIKEIELDNVVVKGDKDVNTHLRSNILPGSYVSYDRFIRLAILKFLNNSGRNFEDSEMLLNGEKIMASVIVPRNKGYFYYNYLLKDINIIKHDKKGNILYGGGDDYTQYIVMYDLNKKELNLKDENSLNWKNFKIE